MAQPVPADGSAPVPMSQAIFLLADSGLAPDAGQLATAGISARILPWAGDMAALAADLLAAADVIIVQIDDPRGPLLARLIETIGARLPVIAATAELTVSTTRKLMRAGAADVLPLPFTIEELRQSFDALGDAGRNRASGKTAARRARIISFLGAIGGVGNSSIATQSAILMAAGKNSCLIDFDLQFGNAALLLDLHPPLHIGQLIEEGESLDAGVLQTVATPHESGLSLIARPTDMVPIEVIDSKFVDRLLTLAGDYYDVIIADMPTLWSEWTIRVLQRSDLICLITDLSVPSLYQARRQLEMISANGLASKLKLLANRVQKGLFSKVSLTEVESALGRMVDFSIANDYPAFSAANDQGKAVRDVKAGSRVLKDLDLLAKSLLLTLETEGAG